MSEDTEITSSPVIEKGIINRDRIFDIRTSFINTHLDRVMGMLPDTGFAVDLGCGAGMGAIALAQRGWGAIGVDVDFSGNEIPYAVQRATTEGLSAKSVTGGSQLTIPQNRELLFVQGDARDSLQIPDNTADLVTSFFTAGPLGVHEDPWKKIYGEGVRVLKEGGMMMVTTEQEQQVQTIMEFLNELGLTNLSVTQVPTVFDGYAITGSK